MTTQTEMHEESDKLLSDAAIARATKSYLDIGIPGFSLYMDKQFSAGAMHTLGGLGASILLRNPLGMWLAAANSISRSANGKNLWDYFSSKKS